jgi:hypothetical protein
MPLTKHGTYHANPQIARMHEMAGVAKKTAPEPHHEEHAARGHVELHHGPTPDGKGKYHTIHHPSGEVRAHESLHEAHHALNEHMAEDGCKDENCREHGAEETGEGDEQANAGEDYEY